MSIEIDSIKRYQCDQSCTKNTKIIIDLCARGTNLSLKNRDQTNAEEKTRSWISKFNQENARTALISRTHHTNNFMKKINVQIQNLETELERMDEFEIRISRILVAAKIQLDITNSNLKARSWTDKDRDLTEEKISANKTKIGCELICVDPVEIELNIEKEHVLEKINVIQKLKSDEKSEFLKIRANLLQVLEILKTNYDNKLMALLVDDQSSKLHQTPVVGSFGRPYTAFTTRHSFDSFHFTTRLNTANPNYFRSKDLVDDTQPDMEVNEKQWRERAEKHIVMAKSSVKETDLFRNKMRKILRELTNKSKFCNTKVNDALAARIYNLTQQIFSMKKQLLKNETELERATQNHQRILDFLKNRNSDQRVNCTRRAHRNTNRPSGVVSFNKLNTENIDDSAEFQLLYERGDLEFSQELLTSRKQISETIVKDLEQKISVLKQEIRVKDRSLEIDQKVIVAKRKEFPSDRILAGYIDVRFDAVSKCWFRQDTGIELRKVVA